MFVHFFCLGTTLDFFLGGTYFVAILSGLVFYKEWHWPENVLSCTYVRLCMNYVSCMMSLSAHPGAVFRFYCSDSHDMNRGNAGVGRRPLLPLTIHHISNT